MNELTDYIPADDSDPPAASRIPDDLSGLRLDQALAKLYPAHSRSRLQLWLKEGRIRLDGATPEARRKVWGGEWLEVDAPLVPEQTAAAPEEIPLRVVFEDDSLLVIDKPAGLVVHPGSGNWSGTLLNALLHYAPQLAAIPRAGIVHRLDKDTSGLLVVAKTLVAQTDLVRQLQARTVKRHYLALVHGAVTAGGIVEAPIGRHPQHRTRMAVVPGGRPALTRYLLRAALGRTSLIECRLETGRTHQIRVHMAHIGHALVGDPVYGLRRCGMDDVDAFPRQALHAFRLGLNHPVSGAAMEWHIELAEDFAALLTALGIRP